MALDPQTPDHERPQPGALKQLCDDGETIQDGFGRRLTETPGVVSTPPRGGCAASISIAPFRFELSARTRGALEVLRRDWALPNGDTFDEATDLWRHARTLACGFWYRWETPPPPAWLAARAAWHRFVRQTLASSRGRYDTALQVARACARGAARRYEYDAWMAQRDSYEPVRVPHWICGHMVEAAARWATSTRGIVWVEHVAFGRSLSEATGLPYFHAQGRDASGRSIEEPSDSSIIASIAACGEGFNLQQFHNSLVVSPPASGTTWEQLIGRTHRYGQEADEIKIDVALKLPEQRAAFEQSLKDATYIQQTTKQTQKLLLADIDGGNHVSICGDR